MSSSGKSWDPAFRQLNSSIGFDWRLAPYDLDASRAHARMLERIGLLEREELDGILAGLDRIAEEMDDGDFEFAEDDEDIHMAIERRLIEIAGPVGGKLHTARSRNDQVATDLALFVQAHALRDIGLVRDLLGTLLRLAEEHEDWRLPGYTHLQRAQPVSLAHHLLAHFWALRRDAERFRFALGAAAELPLGSGALAGANFDLDREGVAEELGFEGVTRNSLDSTSNRDFALDYLHAVATCGTHLSRLGSELVLWSSSEFGFCEIGEEFGSTSSLMPQKRNPDAAELLRGKAPRLVAAYGRLQGVLHALPLAYNKDLQEDKEGLFDAADTIELCLVAARGMLEVTKFRRERMEEAASDEMLAATDLADLLVRKGVPFREAHGTIAELVRHALEQGKRLSELTAEEVARFSPDLGDDYFKVLREESWIASKVSAGGTAPNRVAEQLEQARESLAQLGE